MACDKCGRDVPQNNDTSLFNAIVTGDPMHCLMTQPRHLLPVFENGGQVCEGSPSRAQYIEGQPRDKRGDYPYDERAEELYRAAYAEMQKLGEDGSFDFDSERAKWICTTFAELVQKRAAEIAAR